MFGKKKKPVNDDKSQSRKGAALMNQMGYGGMTDMSQIESMVYGGGGGGDDDDDDDLEAELAELTGDDNMPAYQPTRGKRKPLDMGQLERMAATSIKDIDVDEDVSDTEDDDLLNELADLSPEVENTPSPPPPVAKKPSPPSSLPTSQALPSLPSYAPGRSQMQGPPVKKPAPLAMPSQLALSSQPVRSSNISNSPSPVKQQSPSPAPSATDMPGIIQERLHVYVQGLENAKSAGDVSKQRRIQRGIKTLQDLLRHAKARKPINEEDIPPMIALGNRSNGTSSSSSVSTPSSEASPTDVDILAPAPAAMDPVSNRPTIAPAQTNNVVDSGPNAVLYRRRTEYKQAALAAKKSGDLASAAKLIRTAKQFDAVIDAAEKGQAVDLSKMPPSPSKIHESAALPKPRVSFERTVNQGAGATGGQPHPPEPAPDYIKEASEAETKAVFRAPDAPQSVLEALTQRLEKYTAAENEAKTAGEGSKARRMGRIVTQYRDSIKAHKAGKHVDYEELPCPPGFAPIPAPAAARAGPSPMTSASNTSPQKPNVGVQNATASGQPSPVKMQSAPPGTAPKPQSTTREKELTRIATSKRNASSRHEQQVGFLKERIREFKQAALDAKKNNDIEVAKKYLSLAKGCQPMLMAAESGLPVDLSQLPAPPTQDEDEQTSFVVVSADDVEPSSDRDEMFKKLEEALIQQIRTGATNAQHYTKLGDIPAATKFQKLEQNNRKDLDSLKNGFKHGDPVPRFHYETKTFSLLRCNTELGENDMELTIVRGIQYTPPSSYSPEDVSTYVKYELPYPSDVPQTGQTEANKHTCDPEYNESMKLQISRKARAFGRVIEKKALKLEIYYKRGFLKSDKLLGTLNVPLQNLESHCTIHQSYDLTDGRKSIGGKLEVKIKIRDPLKTKEVDEMREKWLVIDQFLRTLDAKPAAKAAPLRRAKSEIATTVSMEVLRYEKQQLDKQISYLKDSLSPDQRLTLESKSRLLQEKMQEQAEALKQGGKPAWKAYVAAVEQEMPVYEEEARHLARLGDMTKAQHLLTKKKMAEKELAAIHAKIQF